MLLYKDYLHGPALSWAILPKSALMCREQLLPCSSQVSSPRASSLFLSFAGAEVNIYGWNAWMVVCPHALQMLTVRGTHNSCSSSHSSKPERVNMSFSFFLRVYRCAKTVAEHPCNGYLDHPFKNRHVETEKEILSLLANTGGLVYNQTSSSAYSCSNDDTLT
jgi:hypothetical protein